MIESINHDVLRHYVATRQKIDADLQMIYSLSHLLASFEKYSIDENMELDPVALGHVHQMINKSALNIWEKLDDFIYIVQAKSALEKLEE
ncbi:MAG: hypothetical protein COB30_001775 [Ectothiorhodospiraceae bacterium]|nr:hypothetical protein [Ectothiorhodospiraceae bacterium]MBN4053088.1 hypothetical protein [Gammaproteobacteria bacterium AH-315-K14]